MPTKAPEMSDPVRPTSALTRYTISFDENHDIWLTAADGTERVMPFDDGVYLASEVDAERTRLGVVLNDQGSDDLVTLAQVAMGRLSELTAECERLRASRDEYKALASVGTWHKDCRPNRRKAAEEIQKSQQRIDALAAEVARLTEQLAAAPAGGRPTAEEEEKKDDDSSRGRSGLRSL